MSLQMKIKYMILFTLILLSISCGYSKRSTLQIDHHYNEILNNIEVEQHDGQKLYFVQCIIEADTLRSLSNDNSNLVPIAKIKTITQIRKYKSGEKIVIWVLISFFSLIFFIGNILQPSVGS